MRRILFLVLLAAIPCLGASLDDLRRQVVELRGKENLTVLQYAKLRRTAVDWVDGEIRAGRDVASINQDWMALTGENPSRFETIKEDNGEPLVRFVRLSIATNQPCGVDHTLLVYDKKSGQRIAAINANEVLDKGRYLAGVAVYRSPGTGSWTIATKWFLSWCTSTATTALFRVDRVSGATQRRLYHSSVQARRNFFDDIKIEVNANEVRFPFVDTMPDGIVFKAVRRVTFGPNGIRESTYAKNLAGFLWQRLDKSWGYFDWDGLAVCPAENAWEISIHEKTRSGIFRVSGTKPENLRFDGERKQISPGCKPIAELNRAEEQLMAEWP